jgi:hypothetical protein
MSQSETKTYTISQEELVGSVGNDLEQIALSILKSKGAPIKGNFILNIDPKFTVIREKCDYKNEYYFTFKDLK